MVMLRSRLNHATYFESLPLPLIPESQLSSPPSPELKWIRRFFRRPSMLSVEELVDTCSPYHLRVYLRETSP